MAAEAVIKIKEAENAGKEAIRAANEQAKIIIGDAVKEASVQRSSILDEAARLRASRISQETAKAEINCEDLVRQGDGEREKILSPDPAKREQAIDFIIERIVGVNGNH